MGSASLAVTSLTLSTARDRTRDPARGSEHQRVSVARARGRRAWRTRERQHDERPSEGRSGPSRLARLVRGLYVAGPGRSDGAPLVPANDVLAMNIDPSPGIGGMGPTISSR